MCACIYPLLHQCRRTDFPGPSLCFDAVTDATVDTWQEVLVTSTSRGALPVEEITIYAEDGSQRVVHLPPPVHGLLIREEVDRIMIERGEKLE